MKIDVNTITYRPCVVRLKNGNVKGLFHRWVDRPKFVVNDLDELKVTYTSVEALVELSDGQMVYSDPTLIKFDDHLIDQYAFDSFDSVERRESTNKWIPVSEKLPELGHDVLGIDPYNDVLQACTYDDCGEIKWVSDRGSNTLIVAWMPLPEPYKDESEESEE